MKKKEVELHYCLYCGRMYHPDGKLVRSDLLRYMIYKSAHGNLKLQIVKGICGICQN